MECKKNLLILLALIIGSTRVAGCPGSFTAGEGEEIANSPPVIKSVTADPSEIFEGQTSAVSVLASDPDDDSLTYDWSAIRVSDSENVTNVISGSDSQITFTGPQIEEETDYKVTVEVNDGKDKANDSVVIKVKQDLSSLIVEPGKEALSFIAGFTESINVTATTKDGSADSLEATSSDTSKELFWLLKSR